MKVGLDAQKKNRKWQKKTGSTQLLTVSCSYRRYTSLFRFHWRNVWSVCGQRRSKKLNDTLKWVHLSLQNWLQRSPEKLLLRNKCGDEHYLQLPRAETFPSCSSRSTNLTLVVRRLETLKAFALSWQCRPWFATKSFLGYWLTWSFRFKVDFRIDRAKKPVSLQSA